MEKSKSKFTQLTTAIKHKLELLIKHHYNHEAEINST